MKIIKLKIATAVLPIILIALLQNTSQYSHDRSDEKNSLIENDEPKFIKETIKIFVASK